MSGPKPPLIFLIPSLADGGAERVSSILLPFLAKHFDLTLALLEDRKTYHLPAGVSTVSFSKPLAGPVRHVTAIPYHIYCLYRLVRQRRAKVVLSVLQQANLINLLAASFSGHKTILCQHVEPSRHYTTRGLFGRIILQASRFMYPRADQVVAVSKAIQQVLRKDHGLRPEKVSVIYNPLDLQNLRQEASESPNIPLPPRFILHVGRLRLDVKGQDLLLTSFQRLRLQHPELSLVMVGEGPDREKIEKLIREMDLTGAAILTGWQDKVAALMARAEAFVLSSRYEGLPMVLLEAMGAGCPVVASECQAGLRELLGDSEFGILVAPETPEALANGVERLLSDPGLRVHYHKQGLERANNFKLEKIGGQYVQLIEQVLQGGLSQPINSS